VSAFGPYRFAAVVTQVTHQNRYGTALLAATCADLLCNPLGVTNRAVSLQNKWDTFSFRLLEGFGS
jgi:hypothetical protein